MIGKADVPGVLYATGFSGHGFLQGPAVGEIIRDLYLDREPFMDPAPFSAERFGPTNGRCSTRCTSSRSSDPPSVHQKGSSFMISTSERTDVVSLAALRADFALRLADLYGTEVPAYNTLVEVSREVNSDVAAAKGERAERLGSIDRVTAERHGAIRVGSPRELAEAARVFAGFGMHPVGFYDLRDASTSSVPVVATAFRPTDADELAKNPFRVFTSMLVTTDRRFFDAETQERLEAFIAARTLFGAEAASSWPTGPREQQGLDRHHAERFLQLATAAFELSTEPVDHGWYFRLEKISSVAADIGGVPSTHINHLTPRVLDIDALYERMKARGITMIDEIQGPPDWEGPDVLLRQTSFQALAEERQFRHADGTDAPVRCASGSVRSSSAVSP